MADALFWTGSSLALVGAALTVIGAFGVLRFPDVYTRIHAASVTDTGGATLVLLGLALMSGLNLVTLKLVIAWMLVMLTSPTAAHALANAAFSSGHTPWIGGFRIVKGEAAKRSDPR